MTEWSAAWPLPGLAIGLISVLVLLRFVVPPAERGRVAGGIFFAGAYLLAVVGFGLVGRPPPAAGRPDWLRTLAVLLFSFAAVLTSALVLFDVVLARRTVPRIIKDLVQAIAYLITAAVVLTRSDVDVTKVFTASVLTTAVIGLALQDTLGNLVAGLALQVERDFEIGDWISLDARVTGRIRDIRWRLTSIVTKDGDLMLIPNSAITKATIINYSRPTTAHRQTLSVRVHFRHPPGAVRQVVLDAVKALPFVRAEPAPECVLQEFKEDACNYICQYWMDDFQRDTLFDGGVRGAIWYALHRAGMEIPFPSRNVHLTEIDDARADRKQDEEYARRVDALSRVDVFRALDGATIDRLSRRLRHVIHGPGEVILRQGMAGDSLYVVRGGEVSVQRAGADAGAVGREIAALGPGQFFGEMSLMTGEARAATVIAKTDVECYVVDKDAFQQIIEGQPELAGVISEILARRQLELGAETRENAAPAAVRSGQLLSRIATFFGLKSVKPKT